MAYRVQVSFADGRPEEEVRELEYIKDAAVYALKLADALGIEAASESLDRRPTWVNVYSGSRLELGISVFVGGLDDDPEFADAHTAFTLAHGWGDQPNVTDGSSPP